MVVVLAETESWIVAIQIEIPNAKKEGEKKKKQSLLCVNNSVAEVVFYRYRRTYVTQCLYKYAHLLT